VHPASEGSAGEGPRDRADEAALTGADAATPALDWLHIPKFADLRMRTGTAKCPSSFSFLAEWTGLEPATPGVTGRCMK
jgi:hypothetical protein